MWVFLAGLGVGVALSAGIVAAVLRSSRNEVKRCLRARGYDV